VATQWFDDYHEWLMALVVAALLASRVLFRGPLPMSRFAAWGTVALSVAMVGLLVNLLNPWSWRDVRTAESTQVLLDQARNFYGTVTVTEHRYPGDPDRD